MKHTINCGVCTRSVLTDEYIVYRHLKETRKAPTKCYQNDGKDCSLQQREIPEYLRVK